MNSLYLGLCLEDKSCFGLWLNNYDSEGNQKYFSYFYSWVQDDELTTTIPSIEWHNNYALTDTNQGYGFNGQYFYTKLDESWPTNKLFYRFMKKDN